MVANRRNKGLENFKARQARKQAEATASDNMNNGGDNNENSVGSTLAGGNRIIVQNHGPLIVNTNYWETQLARGGKIFVTSNAGAFRILLPPSHEPALADMKTAKEVVISRGPWPGTGLPDAVEILFDDHTTDPYAFHLSVESFDRVPLDSDAGDREWVCSVWTRPRQGRPHKALERPCWYRRVPHIPYLKPKGQ